MDNLLRCFVPNLEVITLWKTVLSQLQLEVSETVYKSFMAQTQPLNFTNDILEVAVPTLFCKQRLEERYFGQIQRIIEETNGKKIGLVFNVKTVIPESQKKELNGPLFAVMGEGAVRSNKNENKSQPVGIAARYTLDTFIVGSSNNLAFAVAQGIIKEPGKTHNPFFLYANVGLGKTHLAQAIGNEIARNDPTAKIVYCTSEDFTNELISAMQSRKTASFKNKFRNIDVLIIDDIQFIAGKDSIQEEFFHTFNALYHQQKQIILTSDKPPREIQKLEARLTSRFSAGMIADIGLPDYGTRVAVLRSKRDRLGFDIPDTALDVIAQSISSNFRELEGALKQVVTIALTLNSPITESLVRDVLSRNHYETKTVTATPDRIVEEISRHFRVNKEELVGKGRRQEIVLPRQIVMYFLRSVSKLSLVGVGSVLGGRDHTTILHGCDKIEKQLIRDENLQQDINTIKRNLKMV